MMEFRQYQRVRIKAIRGDFRHSGLFAEMRMPRIGDVATKVEVYRTPPGYELECSDPRTGATEWLVSVATDEVELEVVDSL